MLIYEPTDELLQWAAKRIGIERFRDDARVIGTVSGDRLRAVVVFDTFSRSDCNMHVASDGSTRWLTRAFLHRVFHYPFVECGLRRVTALVPASNTRALTFDRKLGFRDEGYLRDAMPDDDLVVLGMIRSECNYIPKEFQ